MKTIILLFAILFGLIFGIIFFQNPNNKIPLLGKTPKAKIDNQTFDVTIAKSSTEKEIGLSEKNNLSQNEGMLFLFDNADYYAFWMKKMKFPIDIIYIKDGKIITIYKNIPAPKNADENLPIYQPKSPADKVLEINAGLSSKYKFQEGDSVNFENIE